jgi:hypothetical protein
VEPQRGSTSQVRQVISIQRISIVIWQIFLQELGSWELLREVTRALCQLVGFPDSSQSQILCEIIGKKIGPTCAPEIRTTQAVEVRCPDFGGRFESVGVDRHTQSRL